MPPKRARTSPAKKRVQPRARHRSWPKYWRLVAFSALAIAILLLWAAIDRHLAPRANTDQPRFDAILVLGTNADRDGNPTPAMLDRVTEAVREYQRGVAPRLIFSGGAAHNRFVEANVMARVAIAQGIPPSAIFTEPRALDTIQNFCFSFAILRAHQWHSVEVITSAAHMPRAAIILANLPGQNIAWRMRQAPGLYSSGLYQRAAPAVEILKTAHYLVWSRWQESCVP
uniref:DUF218 domain-containing protein n=1 Tax=mine drainage metagenome TaxID=410659 RepID=E6QN05_9ZZZZ